MYHMLQLNSGATIKLVIILALRIGLKNKEGIYRYLLLYFRGGRETKEKEITWSGIDWKVSFKNKT